ncbi:hypothetical protein M5K25_008320 [Dendrobium thyrsiflorum]|uniref:Uncharacterized protein n=1 Tax=Dendrobium thyrsiflorum TaxID=117978 RepID=A0ABD0V9I5_DENTH
MESDRWIDGLCRPDPSRNFGGSLLAGSLGSGWNSLMATRNCGRLKIKSWPLIYINGIASRKSYREGWRSFRYRVRSRRRRGYLFSSPTTSGSFALQLLRSRWLSVSPSRLANPSRLRRLSPLFAIPSRDQALLLRFSFSREPPDRLLPPEAPPPFFGSNTQPKSPLRPFSCTSQPKPTPSPPFGLLFASAKALRRLLFAIPSRDRAIRRTPLPLSRELNPDLPSSFDCNVSFLFLFLFSFFFFFFFFFFYFFYFFFYFFYLFFFFFIIFFFFSLFFFTFLLIFFFHSSF